MVFSYNIHSNNEIDKDSNNAQTADQIPQVPFFEDAKSGQ